MKKKLPIVILIAGVLLIVAGIAFGFYKEFFELFFGIFYKNDFGCMFCGYCRCACRLYFKRKSRLCGISFAACVDFIFDEKSF